MKIRGLLYSLLFLFGLSGFVFAINVDDLVKLKEADIDEEIIFAKTQKEGLDKELSVDDIIELKEAGYSTDTIKALMLIDTSDVEVADEKEVAGNAPVKDAEIDRVIVRDESSDQMLELMVINRHNRTLTVIVDKENRRIVVMPSMDDVGKKLHNNHGIGFKIPAGRYELQFSGEPERHILDIRNANSELRLNTGFDQNLKTLQFRLTQGDKHTNAGILRHYPKVIEPIVKTVYREIVTPTVIVRKIYCSSCNTYYTGSHSCHSYPSRSYYYGTHTYGPHYSSHYYRHNYSHRYRHHNSHYRTSHHYGHSSRNYSHHGHSRHNKHYGVSVHYSRH